MRPNPSSSPCAPSRRGWGAEFHFRTRALGSIRTWTSVFCWVLSGESACQFQPQPPPSVWASILAPWPAGRRYARASRLGRNPLREGGAPPGHSLAGGARVGGQCAKEHQRERQSLGASPAARGLCQGQQGLHHVPQRRGPHRAGLGRALDGQAEAHTRHGVVPTAILCGTGLKKRAAERWGFKRAVGGPAFHSSAVKRSGQRGCKGRAFRNPCKRTG